MSSKTAITLNEAEKRYEWTIEGHLAYAQFERLPGAVAYTHTVVPRELGGRGIGSALVRHILDDARRQGLKVRPDCSFVKAYIDRHPDDQSLLLAPDAEAAMTVSAAPQRFSARRAIVGEDTPIARALPHRARRSVGAWCFLDHAGPVQFAPGKGMHVGAHPHIGLQTFTWMIEGEIIHRDSLGNEQIIRPGQVNLMTAGRGIAHTEDSLHDGAHLHAAQLWIALPESERHGPPAFQNYPDLPRTEAGGWEVTVLAGSALGLVSPVAVHSPLVGLDLVSAGSASAVLALRPDFEYAVMTLGGDARVAGETLRSGEWLYFAPGRAELEIDGKTPAHLLLLGGEPFGEELVIWWNLVARSQAELQSALDDWNAGRFPPVRAGSQAMPLPAPSLARVAVRQRSDR